MKRLEGYAGPLAVKRASGGCTGECAAVCDAMVGPYRYGCPPTGLECASDVSLTLTREPNPDRLDL